MNNHDFLLYGFRDEDTVAFYSKSDSSVGISDGHQDASDKYVGVVFIADDAG